MEVQRTREKALYWKSLNPVFKVDLHGHFRSRLELPPYFSENVKGKLPRKVTLKGPGTDIDTWDVLVTTSTDTTSIIGEGWRSFVAAFGLEENDTLVFKYKEESCFKVRVISGKTLCEKESSHFVAVPNPGGDKLMMKRETERSEEDYGLKERNADAALLHYKRDYSTDYEVIPAEVTESSGSLYTQSRKRSAEAFASPPGVQVKAECTPNSSQSDRLRYAEQRERVSDRAKRIQMCTENSFFISLSRSHVSGAHVKFCIPRKWWEMVIKAKKNQSIRLCRKGEDQSKSHLCYCVYDEKYNTATVTRGWKDFVQENTLQENDCCVFKLAKPWKELEVISLEVEIIRADK